MGVTESKYEYDDPAIVSLQKIPTMSGFPGQSMTPGYSSSPQIPADIWATPTPVQHPPPPPQAAPRAPPGLQAPPGFGGMVAQDQGDGLSILDNAMPLSVDDLERQHLERQQLAQLAQQQQQQQQQQRNYENGLTPIG